jgi:MFS transporter, DHA1 family, inner membrane transport protein
VDQRIEVPPPAVARGGFPIPVLALTMCAFCIGTAEFVVMGLLPDIAHDLSVSIPLAGQLVTAYAIGVVIGAPILAVLTGRLPRKRVLLMMVGVFIVGNLLSAISPSYFLLVIARMLAAFAHGTLFGVGAIVAADLVPPNKRASAIGLMFLGLTLANILGVPLGTLVGHEYGWRATFWAITGLGVVALIPVWLLVPEIPLRPSTGMRREFSVLRQPAVLLAIATTVFGSASVFTFFTYIVPLLEQVTGFTPSDVTLILFMIGVGLTIGITLGGRFADRGVMRALVIMLLTLAAVVAVVGLVAESKWAMLVAVFLWSTAAFAPVSGLQSRVVEEATEAPNLASALNIGAFNLGNAGGALLGGVLIDAGFSLRIVPLAAALVSLVAVGTALLGGARDRRPRPTRR